MIGLNGSLCFVDDHCLSWARCWLICDADHQADPDALASSAGGLDPYRLHPKEYYEYDLVGVLVHTGTAAGGHYYSFVKERATDPLARQSQPDGQYAGRWHEFNDHSVRPFDAKQLEEECFGGEAEMVESTVWGTKFTRTSERMKNAYMLVYERRLPLPNDEVLAAAAASPAVAAAPAAAAEESSSSSSEVVSIADKVAPEVLQEVQADNLSLRRDRQLYSGEFFAFMTQMLKAAGPLPPSFELELEDQSIKQLLQVACKYVCVDIFHGFIFVSTHTSFWL